MVARLSLDQPGVVAGINSRTDTVEVDMSFSDKLQRLRSAVAERSPGVPVEACAIMKDDLRELLYHFDRLDSEVRNTNSMVAPGALVTAVSDAVQRGVSFSVDQKRRDITVEVTCGNGTVQQYRRHFLPGEIRNPWIIKSELTDMLRQANQCFDINPKVEQQS